MKKVIMISLMLFGVLTFAKAQKGNISPQEEATLTTMYYTKALKLNKEQQTKVKAIYLDHANTMRKIKVIKGDGASTLKKINDQNNSSEAKVYVLLTSTQKRALNKIKAEREKAIK